MTASPRPLRNDAHVVNGVGWSPGERVRELARLTIRGWRMHAVYASPQTNESAFMNHVVLIWTVGRHTYALGFHAYRGMREALLLDERLARGVKLIGP